MPLCVPAHLRVTLRLRLCTCIFVCVACLADIQYVRYAFRASVLEKARSAAPLTTNGTLPAFPTVLGNCLHLLPRPSFTLLTQTHTHRCVQTHQPATHAHTHAHTYTHSLSPTHTHTHSLSLSSSFCLPSCSRQDRRNQCRTSAVVSPEDVRCELLLRG